MWAELQAASRESWQDGAVYGFHLGFEAFEAPGTASVAGGGRAGVVGDPVIPFGGLRNFESAVSSLIEDLDRGDGGMLRAARGAFAAYCWNATTRTLTGATDKLGIRPLYLYESPSLLVLSSSLVLAARLIGAAAGSNLQASLERAALGFIVGDDTPTTGLQAIPAGHCVTVGSAGTSIAPYWDWNSVCNRQWSNTVEPERFHEIFLEAVRLRIGKDRTALAMLSGGLDSRAVVAALRALGQRVVTAGMGQSGSADRELSTAAARSLGVAVHTGLDFARSGMQESLCNAYQALVNAARPLEPERPRIVWSGDGGSVGLGHVYLSDDMFRDEGAVDIRIALQRMLAANSWSVPVSALRRAHAGSVSKAVAARMQRTVDAIECHDPARRLHRFLLATDQRWHMLSYLETLPHGGFEMALPFYDSEVIAWIFSRPGGPFLHHRFYNEWVRNFGDPFVSVPWQSYPGHLESPMRVPEGLRRQWDQSDHPRSPSRESRESAMQVVRLITSGALPAGFSKARCCAAAAATLAGWRDYGYLLGMVEAVRNPYRGLMPEVRG